MKVGVGRRIVAVIFELLAMFAFVVLLSADSETPILIWCGVLGFFAVCSTVAVVLLNPHCISRRIVSMSVCIRAFMYDKLHIHTRKFERCSKILKYEGSYSQCYVTGLEVYDKYLIDKKDEF